MTGEPVIIDEQRGYLVVYKPPGIHSAPLKGEPSGTVLSWCARRFPEILAVEGRRPWEGGLLHRLDYETQGLLLLARRQDALDALRVQQDTGRFIKEYEAIGLPAGSPAGIPAGFPPGFPQVPPGLTRFRAALSGGGDTPPEFPVVIESAFRAYGPGRKAVRPAPHCGASRGRRRPAPGIALDLGEPYRTEVTAVVREGDYRLFSLRLRRGFRHQIRCHLAWIGFPLLNDALYGGLPSDAGVIGLAARGLSFLDPFTGTPRNYRYPAGRF